MSKPKVDLDQPTTILTQFGVTSCLPKLARGETLVTNKKHRKKETK